MHFAAPWFLTLLIPLIGVAVWLMSRRGESAEVPFVHLWPRDAAPIGRAWRLGRLPLWIALLLLAALAAILSAADLRIGSRIERPVTLIVDRGVNMSAIDRDGSQVLQQILGEIESLAIAPKRIITIPPAGDVSLDDWRNEIANLKMSAVDSAEMLNAGVYAALREHDMPVLVLTNLDVPRRDRVIVAAPNSPPGFNCGIAHIAAADKQVMIRVTGNESLPVQLRIRSGEATVERGLSLEANRAQDVFVDLPSFGETISAEIVEPDSITADNFAWLARSASWPAIEVRPGAPSVLSRMATVYAKHRESDRRNIVAVTTDAAVKGAAVVIGATGALEMLSEVSGPIEITQEIGRAIDWPAALRGARVGIEPDALWQPLVRVGGCTILAQRDVGGRQVLINFWSDDFAQTPGFVVLMTDVFDSFSRDSQEWSSRPMRTPPSDWQLMTPAIEGFEDSPGVYRDSFQRLHALNAAVVTTRAIRDSATRIESIPTQLADGRRSAAAFALTSMLLLAVGIFMMRRDR